MLLTLAWHAVGPWFEPQPSQARCARICSPLLPPFSHLPHCRPIWVRVKFSQNSVSKATFCKRIQFSSYEPQFGFCFLYPKFGALCCRDTPTKMIVDYIPKIMTWLVDDLTCDSLLFLNLFVCLFNFFTPILFRQDPICSRDITSACGNAASTTKRTRRKMYCSMSTH